MTAPGRRWIRHEIEPVLCMDGFPIRIRMAAGKQSPYEVEVDGRMPIPYWTLDGAKAGAAAIAAELEEFA